MGGLDLLRPWLPIHCSAIIPRVFARLAKISAPRTDAICSYFTNMTRDFAYLIVAGKINSEPVSEHVIDRGTKLWSPASCAGDRDWLGQAKSVAVCGPTAQAFPNDE
jgi:hypothetical protein